MSVFCAEHKLTKKRGFFKDNRQGEVTPVQMAEQVEKSITTSSKKRRKKKSGQLVLSRRGEKRTLQDWTTLDAETLFPNLGAQTYRVPPVHFNRQNVVLQDEDSADSTCDGSAVNGCSAHAVGQPEDDAASAETSPDTVSDEDSLESVDNVYKNGCSFDGPDRSPGKKRKMSLQKEKAFGQSQDCEHANSDREDGIRGEVSNRRSLQANTHSGHAFASQVKVLVPQQQSQVRRDKALSRVLDKLECLSRHLEQRDQKPLFIISSISYDNYLSRLPARTAASFNVPRPQDVARRGQLDILLLHERAGIILVQVKAVGDNLASWTASPEDANQAIARMIDRATTQLDRDQKVFSHVLKDLDPLPSISRVVALPFVSRQDLKNVQHLAQTTWADTRFLCHDDIEASASECCRIKHIPKPPQDPALPHEDTPLLKWWGDNINVITTRLSVQQQKVVVGRVCGLLSSLQVQNVSRARVEVRTYGEAVSETAKRATSACITSDHSQVLRRPDNFLILSGPPGAGKTMLLTLKARQWLQQGRLVVILNMGPKESGFPRAYTLQNAVNCDLPQGTLPAERMNIGLSNMERDKIEEMAIAEIRRLTDVFIKALETENAVCKENQTQIKDKIASGSGYLCFIADEVLATFAPVHILLDVISSRQETQGVWLGTTAVVNEVEWSKYDIVTMKSVLRLPLAVQSLLQRLEWRDAWKTVYSTSSADAGLPTDGPPAIFLHHKHHLTPSSPDCTPQVNLTPPPAKGPGGDASQLSEGSQAAKEGVAAAVSLSGPLQCKLCAEDVARFLKSLLQESEFPDIPTLLRSRRVNTSGNSRSSPNRIEFKDVLIVTHIPRQRRRDNPRSSVKDKEKEELFWSAIRASAFIQSIREHGIPVEVRRDEESQDIAVHSGQNVVFTDVKVARGLERKVVVFVPLCADNQTTDSEGFVISDPIWDCSDRVLPAVSCRTEADICLRSVASTAGELDLKVEPMQNGFHDVSIGTTHAQIAINGSTEATFQQTDAGTHLIPSRLGKHHISEKGELTPEKFGTRKTIPIFEGRYDDTPIKADASQRCSPLPWCIDSVVSSLNELTRKGLYFAASCCVSQLFVVIP